ncbi:MAG: AbrB family transcriptional regulator [Pseudomonadota bacterium]|nr:AbrB family transcriptional regulator [Pseudomonadota bacterium]
MPKIRIAGEEVHLGTTILVFAVGILGGFLAKWAGLPLPMLLGSVIAVGAISIFGFKPGGHPPEIPFWLRLFFIPIIGLSIGAAFTPAVLEEARGWWPSLLALVVYIPLAHFVGYHGFRRLGNLSPVTAYYSAVPGGLLECIAMGEENGADIQMLTALQFMRLILTILLVPLAFTLLSGGAVGSAAGVLIGNDHAPITATEVFWQASLGVAGFFLGRRLNLPAYMITGPILASGVGHLTGLLASTPPRWLIDVTQIVIGTSLGTRFVGMRADAFGKALVLALTNIALTMILAIAAGIALHEVVDEKVQAVVLAFAPGGLAEMSLVAISLQISVLYVTTHHVARIVLSVSVAKAFSGRIASELPPK